MVTFIFPLGTTSNQVQHKIKYKEILEAQPHQIETTPVIGLSINLKPIIEFICYVQSALMNI